MWFEIRELKHAGGFVLDIGELDSKVTFSFILTESDMEALSAALKQKLAHLARLEGF